MVVLWMTNGIGKLPKAHQILFLREQNNGRLSGNTLSISQSCQKASARSCSLDSTCLSKSVECDRCQPIGEYVTIFAKHLCITAGPHLPVSRHKNCIASIIPPDQSVTEQSRRFNSSGRGYRSRFNVFLLIPIIR
jgi:hypothetical protein